MLSVQHVMFTNHIVLKPGTLGVYKQNTFRCSIGKCYNFQCSNLGHFFLQCSNLTPDVELHVVYKMISKVFQQVKSIFTPIWSDISQPEVFVKIE